MKTHILEIDNFHSPEEVADFLGESELQKGDVIKIITEQDKGILVFVVAIIVLVLMYIFKKQERQSDGEKMLDTLFKGKNIDEFEQQVEVEYGIKIEVETKKKMDEVREWQDLAAKNFIASYGEDEPQYTSEDIREPNPTYGKWKKEK